MTIFFEASIRNQGHEDSLRPGSLIMDIAHGDRGVVLEIKRNTYFVAAQGGTAAQWLSQSYIFEECELLSR